MVHVNSDGQILRAYGYIDELKNMPKIYLGLKSKNPLFRYLTREFISDYEEDINDQIGEDIRHENV